MNVLVAITAFLRTLCATVPARLCRSGGGHASSSEHGQATAEYALVLLGAAAVAFVLIAWATGSGKVTELLDGVIDKLLDQV
jgi:Protein of unknown function (DUF4244)